MDGNLLRKLRMGKPKKRNYTFSDTIKEHSVFTRYDLPGKDDAK